MKKILWILIVFGLIISSCGNEKKSDTELKKGKSKPKVIVPEFNSDSAYLYVEKQVDFGLRAPSCQKGLKKE